MNTILVEIKNRVALVTLNRPEKLNALDSTVLSELDDLFTSINPAEVRCVVITGAGKAFAAGADISEMADMNVDQATEFSRFGQSVFKKIETFPVPVIAAVNGHALGGGCELALSCDFRICSEKATFGQPECGLGICPGFGGTQRLEKAVGTGMARELIFTCRRVRADEALRIGLVNSVHAPEELLDKALELANAVAAQAPFAVRASKIAMETLSGYEVEAAVFGQCFTTEDRRQAMQAYLEKRPAAPFENK